MTPKINKTKQQQQQNNNKNKKKNTVTVEVREKRLAQARTAVEYSGYRPNADEALYLRSLMQPFSDTNCDARIPSRNPFPMLGYCAKNFASVTSSNVGSFNMIWFPSQSLCLIVGSGTNLGGGVLTNTDLPSPKLIGSGVNQAAFYQQISDTTLATKLAAVRTTSAGICLANNANFSNIQGRLVCSPVALPDVTYADSTLDLINAGAAATTAVMLANNIIGRANTSVFPIASLTIPGSFEVRLDSLIEKPLMLTTRPITPEGYSLRPCDGQTEATGSSWNLVGPQDVAGSVSGGMSTVNRYCGSCNKGMLGWIISGTGLPTSVTCVDIFLAGNYEGPYSVAPSTSSSLIPSGQMKHSRGGKGFNIETLLSLLPPNSAQIVSAAAINGLSPMMGPIGRGLLSSIVHPR